jgi:pSer/pThr/pTyr-binding forkhead associated (FHA) protein
MQAVYGEVNLKSCKICNHANSLDAKNCENCALPLHGVTETLFEQPQYVESTYFESSPNTLALNKGHAVLYTPSDRQYFELAEQAELQLGRDTQPQADVMLDITPYGGRLLGVSRQHAVIIYCDGIYKVTDLQSRWGTYLNDKQLQPGVAYMLHNGDMLRLGGFQVKVQLSQRNFASNSSE